MAIFCANRRYIDTSGRIGYDELLYKRKNIDVLGIDLASGVFRAGPTGGGTWMVSFSTDFHTRAGDVGQQLRLAKNGKFVNYPIVTSTNIKSDYVSRGGMTVYLDIDNDDLVDLHAGLPQGDLYGTEICFQLIAKK